MLPRRASSRSIRLGIPWERTAVLFLENLHLRGGVSFSEIPLRILDPQPGT